MAKFCGIVGYSETTETSPDVWTESITEKPYFGDVLRNTRRWQSGENLNDNLVVNNQISIVADAYAYEHFSAIRYVKWHEVLWKVTNVEVQRPRLLLTVGGVYNGKSAEEN